MRNATPSKRKREFIETCSSASHLLLTPLGNNTAINGLRPSHACIFSSGDGLAIASGKASLIQDLFGRRGAATSSIDIESIDWDTFLPSNVAHSDSRILYSSADGGVEMISYNDTNEVSVLQLQLSLAHEEYITTVTLLDEMGLLGSNKNEVYLIWSHDEELFVHQLQPSRGFLNTIVTTGSKLLFGSGPMQPSVKKTIPLGSECMVITNDHVSLWSEFSIPSSEVLLVRLPLGDVLRPNYTDYFHCDVAYDVMDASYIHGNLYLLATVMVHNETHLWYHHLHYTPHSLSSHFSAAIDTSHSFAQLTLTPSVLFISYSNTTLHVIGIDLMQPYAAQASVAPALSDTAIDPSRLLCVGHLAAHPAPQPTLMILLQDGTRLACCPPLLNPPPVAARVALETPRKAPVLPESAVKQDVKRFLLDILMSYVLNETSEEECISSLTKHLFNSKMSLSQLQDVLSLASEHLLTDDAVRLPTQRALARKLEQHFRLISIVELYQNQSARDVLPAAVYRCHNLLAATHILSQALQERSSASSISSKIRFSDIGHNRLITRITKLIDISELKPLDLPETLQCIVADLTDASVSDAASCSMIYNMCSIVLAMGKTTYDKVDLLVTDASQQLCHCIFSNKKIYASLMRLLEHFTVLVQHDASSVATMKKDAEGRRLKELCSLLLQTCDEAMVDCKPTCIDIFLSLGYFDISYQLSIAHSHYMGIMTSVYRSPSLVPMFHQYVLEEKNKALNDFALLWLQTEGMIAELLELGKYCKEDLELFIENRPNVAWMAHLQHRNYSNAATTSLTAHTTTDPSTASTLLSISKLCAFAALEEKGIMDEAMMVADEQLMVCKGVRCCEEFGVTFGSTLPSKEEVCSVLLSNLQAQSQHIPRSDLLRLLSTAASVLSVYNGNEYAAYCSTLVEIAVKYDAATWEEIACSTMDNEEAMLSTLLFALIKAAQLLHYKSTPIYDIVLDDKSALSSCCKDISEGFDDELKQKVESGLHRSIVKCIGLALSI